MLVMYLYLSSKLCTKGTLKCSDFTCILITQVNNLQRPYSIERILLLFKVVCHLLRALKKFWKFWTSTQEITFYLRAYDNSPLIKRSTAKYSHWDKYIESNTEPIAQYPVKYECLQESQTKYPVPSRLAKDILGLSYHFPQHLFTDFLVLQERYLLQRTSPY